MNGRSARHRVLLGIPLTPQWVALLLAVLVLAALIGLAVVSWLKAMT